jgi:hypothetical protein
LRNRIGRRKKHLHCKTLNHLQANLYTILFTDWILLQSANELGFFKWRIFSSNDLQAILYTIIFL